MTGLKEKLIERIESTTDSNVLMEVYRLLQIDSQDDELYELSNDHLEAIKEADNQIDKGQFHHHEEANSLVKEWLKRK